MKKFFLFFLLLVAFSFGADKEKLISLVKQNPQILDTPRGKLMLEANGITKKEVLSIINESSQKASQPIAPLRIENKVEKIQQKPVKEIKAAKAYLQKSQNPFVFVSLQKLLERYKKLQKKENKKPLKRFGEKFFYNKNTQSSQILAVPEYYTLNVGDIVEVKIFGAENKMFELKIDNYGNIDLPILGPIRISGYSVMEAKEFLKKKLSPTYPNSKIGVFVKINSFIQVTLAGFVDAPGVYNLSSLSTVKDLLIAANGFGKIGSMREVYLKRANRVVKIIDFYKLIKNGEVVDTTLLRNGDVVYVPKAKKQISLRGEVAQEAIYELKKSENLKDLLNYCGGLKPSASKKEIKIKRYLKNNSQKIIITSLEKNASLFDGDKVYVFNIGEMASQKVEIYGNVERAGEYSLPKDGDIKILLKKVVLLKDTLKDYAIVERFNGEVVSFDLNNPAIKIENKDKIYIFNKCTCYKKV